MHSVKLNEIFLAGSKMPKKVEAIDMESNKLSLLHQERIAYSQLEKLHEQHGDQVSANEYFAQEMNTFYAALSWRKHFGEKLALAFNKFSSDHGHSWERALGMTILISAFFYFWFSLSLGYLPGSIVSLKNWYLFFQLLSYLLEFINPVHRLENFVPLQHYDHFSVASRIIDGITRIFIAYLVYQLIQAFRKHGKFCFS